MKKTIAIIMSALIITSGLSTVEATIRPKTDVVSTQKHKVNVNSTIKSAKTYGRKLGMHYNKTLNKENSSWFAPTNTKYYKTTKELTKAIKGDVKYVAYFYKDSGIRPEDIEFNVVKVNSKIYVCYN